MGVLRDRFMKFDQIPSHLTRQFEIGSVLWFVTTMSFQHDSSMDGAFALIKQCICLNPAD